MMMMMMMMMMMDDYDDDDVDDDDDDDDDDNETEKITVINRLIYCHTRSPVNTSASFFTHNYVTLTSVPVAPRR